MCHRVTRGSRSREPALAALAAIVIVAATSGACSGASEAGHVDGARIASPNATLPAPPTSLNAIAASRSQIDLTWVDASANEDGFRIERCAGAGCGTFGEIRTLTAAATAYRDSGLQAATSYSYRVRAFNATGASAYSNVSTATTRAIAAVTSWDDYATLFPFTRTSGALQVRSDLSQAFTDAHLDMLARAWRYFSAEIGRSPGLGTTIHYTTDSVTYVSHGPLCPHIGTVPWFRDARQTSACWNVPAPGQWTWVVMPYRQPDFGTILHEIGHTFSQTVFPAQEDYPWLKEGTGMYWEGGEPASDPAAAFDATGNLIVNGPAAYTISGFRRWDSVRQLLPLRTLLTMPRSEFYGNNDWSRQYSQAGMFILFLEKTYPGMLAEMWARMRTGAITTNAQLLVFIEARTANSIESLEQAYLAFARK